MAKVSGRLLVHFPIAHNNVDVGAAYVDYISPYKYIRRCSIYKERRQSTAGRTDHKGTHRIYINTGYKRVE